MGPEEVGLLLRKQRLQMRVAEQRLQCLSLLQEIEGVTSTVERARGLGMQLLALLREHAGLGAAAAGLLMLWRPRRAFGWARRAWVLWLLLRRNRGRLSAWLRLASRLAGLRAGF